MVQEKVKKKDAKKLSDEFAKLVPDMSRPEALHKLTIEHTLKNMIARLTDSFRRAVIHDKVYFRLNVLWMLAAGLTLWMALTSIGPQIVEDFATPAAVLDSFIPIMRVNGAERALLRVIGLKYLFCIYVLILAKVFNPRYGRRFSFLLNYVLLSAVVLVFLRYAIWSTELMGCRDCSMGDGVFLPLSNVIAIGFVLISFTVLICEVIVFVRIISQRRAESFQPPAS